MNSRWYAFIFVLIGRFWSGCVDDRRPDSLRRDVCVWPKRSDRKRFLKRIGEIARTANTVLDAARQEQAAGASKTTSPALDAVRQSREVAIMMAITELRQHWVEPPTYRNWSPRQIRSGQLLIAYCMEPDDTIAEAYLATVGDVEFFRRWRNKVQGAAKSAKRKADRAAFLEKFELEQAKLRSVWEEATKDPAKTWSGVGDTMREPVPETPMRKAIQQAAPDPWLWHVVATDQHELNADRAACIFWILDQPECDRATVAEFIAGYLESENYWRAARAAAAGGNAWQFSAFADLVARWNSALPPNQRINRKDAAVWSEDGRNPRLLRATKARIIQDYARVHLDTGMPIPEVPRGLSRALDGAPPKTTLSKTGPLIYDFDRRRIVEAAATE